MKMTKTMMTTMTVAAPVIEATPTNRFTRITIDHLPPDMRQVAIRAVILNPPLVRIRRAGKPSRHPFGIAPQAPMPNRMERSERNQVSIRKNPAYREVANRIIPSAHDKLPITAERRHSPQQFTRKPRVVRVVTLNLLIDPLHTKLPITGTANLSNILNGSHQLT